MIDNLHHDLNLSLKELGKEPLVGSRSVRKAYIAGQRHTLLTDDAGFTGVFVDTNAYAIRIFKPPFSIRFDME